MAVVADQYLIELQSNIGKVVSREEAALKKLDKELDRTAREVAKLEGELDAAAAALQKSTAGKNGVVNVGEVRAAQKELVRVQGALDKARSSQETLGSGRAKFADQADAAKAAAVARELEKQRAGAAKEADREAKESARSVEKQRLDAAKLADRESKEAARQQKQRDREAIRARKDADREAKSAARQQKQRDKEAEQEQKKAADKAMEQYRAVQKANSAAALVAPFAAAAAVVATVIGAVAALVAGYLSLAVAAASAARNQRLLGEALTGSEAGGKEFSGVVDQLARQIPIAKDRIREWARELSLAKLAGRDMQATLTTMGIVASAVGDQGASAIKSIAEQSRAARRFMLGARDIYGDFASLAGTGIKKADILGALANQLKTSTGEVEKRLLEGSVSVEQGMLALEAAAKGRFGQTIAAQMLNFDTQITKARESLDSLFADVDLGPILDGLKTVLSALDSSSQTGQGLKLVLTSAFKDFGEIVTATAPIAKAFFQGMIIAGLRMYIALKPVYNQVRDLFGGKPGDGLEVAAKAGERALYAMAAAAAVVGVSMFIALFPVIVLAGLVAVAIYAIGAAWEALRDIDFVQLGSDAVDGIISGITGAASRALAAIKGLGKDMYNAFREAIDAHSPSRLFAQAGVDIAAGTEGGIEEGTPGVQSAIVGMADATPASTGGGSGGRGGTTIGSLTIGSIVMGNGKPVEADIDSMVRATFRRVLEEINESGLVAEPV